LHNSYSSLSAVDQSSLGATLAGMKRCHGDASCWQAARPPPGAAPK
jgi:hypothetical protein